VPSSTTSLFASLHRSATGAVVPAELELKVAFAELKLDLRDAVFPPHVTLVTESLCASVEVLLPQGVTLADNCMAILSSHKVRQAPNPHAPVICLEGWSVCSDVKFISVPTGNTGQRRVVA
jgi:hypothetical protein